MVPDSKNTLSNEESSAPWIPICLFLFTALGIALLYLVQLQTKVNRTQAKLNKLEKQTERFFQQREKEYEQIITITQKELKKWQQLHQWFEEEIPTLDSTKIQNATSKLTFLAKEAIIGVHLGENNQYSYFLIHSTKQPLVKVAKIFPLNQQAIIQVPKEKVTLAKEVKHLGLPSPIFTVCFWSLWQPSQLEILSQFLLK